MLQRLRLIAGITLFVFVTTHLLNHALGLFSIAAADAGPVSYTHLTLPTIYSV